MLKKVEDLAKLYTPYKIYPKECYSNYTPVKVFQKLYGQDHYSKEIKSFLKYHNYSPVRKGADLPWWGRSYFSGKKGFRTMIIGQDSLSKYAGSVVLFSHLLPEIDKEDKYNVYVRLINKDYKFHFISYIRIRNHIIGWNIDINFMFVTDALKVYQEYPSEQFDRTKSRDLLQKEIETCKPDLLILLGSRPYYLLRKFHKRKEICSEIMVKNVLIEVLGIKTVVTPFPIGQGPSQPNFKKHRLNAASLIRQRFEKWIENQSK